MIKIVDYGLGNILAFQNVYKRLNVEVGVARTAGELADASRIILPGVGAFDHAMELLDASGMRVTLDELVLKRRVPVLGICVGMQMLAAGSDEGKLPGLGWIDARVRGSASLAKDDVVLPHMGLIDVQPVTSTRRVEGVRPEGRFYFLHSYYFECAREQDVAARTTYGVDFACAVQASNIFGVQFHPEKSHHFGTQLLKNFAELPC
jgi:glutamine amidotransferase